MSEVRDNNESACCASCGIAEIDDVKLKDCDDCDLVRYCSDECQQGHQPEHEEACKRRAAELRDELLFKQPESNHLGDCPICMLPMPFGHGVKIQTMTHCCSKIICNGCNYAHLTRVGGARLEHSCPFCRKPAPSTDEEGDKLIMKRVEANDPAALSQEGASQYKKGNYTSAFEYFTKAAGLGNVDARYHLSISYYLGQGVEKDEGKGIYHMEEAAIGGHPTARYILGLEEWGNRNAERAVKHWTIAASQGEDESIKHLTNAYKKGFVKKEDLGAALRAHQAAVDATKSPQREIGEQFR